MWSAVSRTTSAPPNAPAGFFDDSGNAKGPVFVLAGFMASFENWERFADAWKAALAENPAIRYYKNSQAMSCQDEFENWSYIDVQKKISRLTRVIIEHVEHRVSMSINTDEFDRHLRANVFEPLSDPYYVLFIGIITKTILYLEKQNERHPVSFIFDHQGKVGHAAAEIVQKIKAHPHFPLREKQSDMLGGIPIFADDKELVALQAADLYAGNVRRFYIDNKRLYMPLRQQMRELMSIPGIAESIDARNFSRIVAENLIHLFFLTKFEFRK